MTKIFFSLLAGTLLAGMVAAQSSPQSSGSAGANGSVSTGQSGQAQSSASANAAAQPTQHGENQLQAGSIVYAELSKSIDAKKAKPGDEVQAKASQAVLSQGKVVIPKGSKIIGHVTQAKAREKGQEQSSLGIAFDHAVLKDGTQVPLSGVSIQAIGSPQSSAALAAQEENPSMGGPPPGMPSGGGMGGRPGTGGGALGGVGPTVGGVGNTAGGVANTAGGAVGTGAGTTQAGSSLGGHLGASSHGVVNMPGLSMSAAAGNSTQGSVITSDRKNVKLDSGTEMVLKVNQ